MADSTEEPFRARTGLTGFHQQLQLRGQRQNGFQKSRLAWRRPGAASRSRAGHCHTAPFEEARLLSCHMLTATGVWPPRWARTAPRAHVANRNRNRNPHPRPISTPSPALTPTPDSNQHKSGAARGVQRVCVLSFLYAQSLSQAVFVHKFAPGPSAAADGAPGEPRCLAAARALPHVQQLLQQFPGQFVPESRLESSAVAAALRDRGDGLRRLHLQEFNNETAGKFPAPRAFELNLNAVRLWYREPKPCHDARATARHNSLSEGEQHAAFCIEGAPRIAWSNLHTYEIGRGSGE